MDKLITYVAAVDVKESFKETARSWPLWDSRLHPQNPPKSGKFKFEYNGDYETERVLVVSGKATLTPEDGSAPLTIGAGDQVFFHKGLKCSWQVTEPMTKHYAYFNEEGKEVEQKPSISCDVCGAECYEESYLTKDEEDICPDCYKADRNLYEGAEHQRFGEAVVPESTALKREAPESNGHNKKLRGDDEVEEEEEEEEGEEEEDEEDEEEN